MEPGSWALLLAAVSTATTVAGAASSAHASTEAGKANQEAANYRAQVARNNAKIAEGNADYVLQAGRVETYQQGMKGRAHLGSVKAAQAASGVDVNTGSAVDVRASEAATNRLDQLTTEHNAQLKAYGYRTQAAQDEAEAGLEERGGSFAAAAGRREAAGTVLGAASSLAFKWGTMLPTSSGGGAGSSPGAWPKPGEY